MIEPTTHRRAPWIPVAAVLLGAGWGSNQFTPMLLVYHARLGLSTSTLEALFGAYAAGLIPGLLLAGRWSDRRGRRAPAIAAVILSLVASATLLAGTHTLALLFMGRLLAGLGSGAAFGAGTAWLRETSLPPWGDASAATAGRRGAVARTAGFAFGPMTAGVLAQWAPSPTVLPYLPHIALMALVLALVWRVPETSEPHATAEPSGVPPHSRARFVRVVLPMALWVFTAPAIAFALMPSVVGAARAADGVALTAAVTSTTALAGVLVQPLGRLLEQRPRVIPTGVIGLLVLGIGLALAALTADIHQTWLLLPCALVLGASYGLCLIAGLLEVQRLAPQRSLAELTGIYYSIAYVGFGTPYLLALASVLVGYPLLLLASAGLASATAAWTQRASLTPATR
jgi:Major Facilitator Superfamily